MTEFTPLASLIGGMMIGLSAVLLMLVEGHIAGFPDLPAEGGARVILNRPGFAGGCLV